MTSSQETVPAPAHVDTSARLRGAVAARELELRRAMRNLQQQARASVDLGHLLEPHMPLILAAAFVAGFWIGIGRPR